VSRRLGNQWEEVKKYETEIKNFCRSKYIIANVDLIEKALEEASEAEAEAEGRKPQVVAKTAITLGQLEKELRRGLDMLEKAKICLVCSNGSCR
jgi:predicted ribosome quality control (RQC) complex YloA/Tae2 family protein